MVRRGLTLSSNVEGRPKRWPAWSKHLVLALLIALGAILVVFFTDRASTNKMSESWLNLVVACLALLSAIVIAVADSVHGIDTASDHLKVRISGWLKIVGHAALISSIGYVVALACYALN